MDLSALAALPPDQLRAVIPQWLSSFILNPESAATNRDRVAGVVVEWSDSECVEVVAAMQGLGAEHRIYPAHTALRRVSRVWCKDVLLQPVLEGIEHLRAAAEAGPTMILGNHLSYFDANALDAVLDWTGHTDLADRIVAAAGPKVYQELFRVLAAACINTLPVPQSNTLDHTEKLSPREQARKALEGVKAAGAAMDTGYLPLVYPEGSRARSGRLGAFIPAVHRWLRAADNVSVVPLAISGTEAIMPIGDTRLTPGSLVVRFGAPLHVGPDGSSKDVLESAHCALGRLLPDDLKPE